MDGLKSAKVHFRDFVFQEEKFEKNVDARFEVGYCATTHIKLITKKNQNFIGTCSETWGKPEKPDFFDTRTEK